MPTRILRLCILTALGAINPANLSLCESYDNRHYAEIRTAYQSSRYDEVVKDGMPFLRKIALQDSHLPSVNAAWTEVLILSQSSRKIAEAMEGVRRHPREEGQRVKSPIQKGIEAFEAVVSDLKKLESGVISGEPGKLPSLNRARMNGDGGLSKEEQAILDMLVDSTRRVKDAVVFEEYLRIGERRKREDEKMRKPDHGITGRLDDGITRERDSDKTRKRKSREVRKWESGNKENGLEMLPDYVYAYLALTRSPGVLVNTIEWMPHSLKGAQQLLEFVDLCSRLEEHDSAIALCEEIVERFYGKDVAAEALQKQAKICVGLKRFDEAVATNQQIIHVYRSDAELVHSQFNLKARYQIIRIYGYELKMYSAGIRECKKLIDAFPDTEAAVYAEYLIGQFLYQNQEYAKAAEAFQKYIEKGKERSASNLVEAKLLLALSYMGQQKEDDAVAVLRRIVAEHPSNKLAPKAQFLLGYCFLTRQRYAEAREEFKKLLDKYPGSKYEGQAAEYVERLKGVQLPNHNEPMTNDQ